MKNVFLKIFKPLTAFLIIIANFFLWAFNLPQFPSVTEIDMSKFEEVPVFSEEFDDAEINEDVWSGHYTYGDRYSVRRGGYWHRDMASVYGGSLHIKTEYLDEGLGGGPEGWYSYGMDTNGKYEQTYGYFECRCIFPKGMGHWSAFWLLTDSMMNTEEKGLNGAEIDVFESFNYGNKLLQNSTKHTIHIDGYGDFHDADNDGSWRISGDPFNEFHTYGVEWNEEGYTFYIDGRKTSFNDFGGASRVPEYMILSVEVGGENGVPDGGLTMGPIYENEGGKDFTSDFVIDYVRAYKYK